MAQGLVTLTNPKIIEPTNKVQEAYGEIKRLLDRMVALRGGGTDYTSIATLAGCPNPDSAQGLKLFDDIDAALGGLTTAYNALSQLDNSAL